MESNSLFSGSQLRVDAKDLTQALDLLDAKQGDRPELHCADGGLIVQQGFVIRSVRCTGSFRGTFSMAVTSATKWQSRTRKAKGSVDLLFEDGKLKVAGLSLPVKWRPDVPKPLPNTPRLIRGDTATDNENLAEESTLFVRTCVNFRVNVATRSLMAVMTHFAKARLAEDLYLRTWNGELVLESRTTEVRIEAVGKIQGFAVLPASELRHFATSQQPTERYTTLVCEHGKGICLEKKITFAKKATPLEEIRKAHETPRKMRIEKVPVSKQQSTTTGTLQPLQALLKMSDQQSRSELQEMGLLEAVEAAIKKRDSLLAEATELLRPLGITSDQIRHLLE